MTVLSPDPRLIEPSFAEAITIIAASDELSPQTRQHWATSLRQVAKALDRPPEVIPARYSAVRADLINLHHAPAGLTAKTLQNHKSNAKRALLYLAREKGIPRFGAPLAPQWQRLHAVIDDKLVRWRLSSLMRFCSTHGIQPNEVTEDVVDRFMAYRASIGQGAASAFRRLVARAWNANLGKTAGWPKQRLREPVAKPATDVCWDTFPDGLRRDVDSYLQGLTRIRRSRSGQRIRPLKPSTIRTRKAEIMAAARMAVTVGVPVATLDSLAALLEPAIVEKILDAYWRRNGEEPKAFTINLACRFLAIAEETKAVDEAACERLDELRRALEDHRHGGLTDKNLTFIRKVLTPGVWTRVLALPEILMERANVNRSDKPVQAAVEAQMAVAIAILSVAPVRLANLTTIRLDSNLIKPDGPHSDYWLVFPKFDVKNRVRLEFPLPQRVSRLLEDYVHDFRPALLRGRNDDWLFPGQRAGAKNKISFSTQIAKRIYKETGVRMTVHQFRHAAGALILKHRPGEYELVRQLLGHKSTETTVKSYIGLDSIRASEIFSDIVLQQMTYKLETEE